MSDPTAAASADRPLSPGGFRCHVCGGWARALAEYAGLSRVTSDCVPWPSGGALGVCGDCGALVVRADAAWRAECEQIYSAYRIYHQAGGAEQVVAREDSMPVGRSVALLEGVHGALRIPERGRLLDVGCGNGGFLRGFTSRFPGWSAVGSEFDGRHRAEVEAVAGVEKLHTGPLSELRGEGFDLIALVHVLEHIAEPAEFLNELRPLLRPGGRLLIQLPYYVQNPVELLIADHATHFSAHSLRRLLEAAGWSARVVTSDWIPKELSCVAEADGGGRAPGPVVEEDVRLPHSAVGWVKSFRDAALAASDAARGRGGAMGIFGTAIAGVWLAGELGERAQFFVDEDPARIGGTLHGLPVLAPASIPSGATVFMGVSPVIADRIAKRIQRGDIHLVPPPANPC